jgi:hypothetical protein
VIGAVLALRFDHSERPTRSRALGLAVGFAGVVALVGIDVAGRTDELLAVHALHRRAIHGRRATPLTQPTPLRHKHRKEAHQPTWGTRPPQADELYPLHHEIRLDFWS